MLAYAVTGTLIFICAVIYCEDDLMPTEDRLAMYFSLVVVSAVWPFTVTALIFALIYSWWKIWEQNRRLDNG